MSELTEDRTQRHFEVLQREYHGGEYASGRPRPKIQTSSPMNAPPSYIIGVKTKDQDSERDSLPPTSPLDGLRSTGGKLPPRALAKSSGRDSPSISNLTEKKLSVAERARLNADRQSTPVKVRVDDSMVRAVEEAKRKQQEGLLSGLSDKSPNHGAGAGDVVRRVGEALLGRQDEIFSDDDDGTSIYSTRVTDYTDASGMSRDDDHDEKKVSETASATGSVSYYPCSKLAFVEE